LVPAIGPRGFEVELTGDHAETIQVDQIIANVGFRPCDHLHEELTIPEPNFHVLGAKRYGRRSDFLYQDGLKQIRETFAIIGDRPALDLYAGATRLIR
jgi:hypothetical protein